MPLRAIALSCFVQESTSVKGENVLTCSNKQAFQTNASLGNRRHFSKELMPHRAVVSSSCVRVSTQVYCFSCMLTCSNKQAFPTNASLGNRQHFSKELMPHRAVVSSSCVQVLTQVNCLKDMLPCTEKQAFPTNASLGNR